ncbi:MAG TPA: beta-propeller fold lactonase family protein [Terracidiphilus sp.]|jgi:6-phosphogluconolactonase (cycloisomerase 2 family)|nr:beta-propeller fold lactonase family protein [Terracidiphilus sp.]
MRFTKFGKALLIGALSAGVVFGVTSCVQSYTVGYLYVTGTVTAQSGNNGIISGFKIDHNTGKLSPINGLPVASGGSNPVRAVLPTGGRFLYVLNRGTNAEGNGDCTPSDPCKNSNITQFAVGANGILTYQQTFFTEGINPFRLLTDTSGNYILALDHEAPSSAACQAALGKGVTSCGDVTVFQINQTTGRLSVVENAAVTQANCSSGALFPCPLTYFPVPANPVDFVMSGSSYLLTLSSSTAPTSYPYTGGSSVWPYTYTSSSGQLTLSSNSAQPLGITAGTAIVNASSNIYVLDNEPVTIVPTAPNPPYSGTYPSQILPFTVGAGGNLAALGSSVIPDASTLSNPIQLLVAKDYLYVANQGNNVTGNNNPGSGIAAYQITTSPSYQTSFVSGQPFGSGSGPQCIVEDPSNQFIYEANQYDSSITGRILDPNSGELKGMRVTSTYTLQGPPTWCLMDGRTG